MRRTSFTALAAVSFLALATASPARSAWIPDGTPLWPGHVMDTYPTAVADGRGGFFASPTWLSWVGGSDTTFFRLAADGNPAIGWPRRKPTGLFSVSNLAPDGDGGAYFATSAQNLPAQDMDVRVFHLRSNGDYDPAFGPAGLLVAVSPVRTFPQIAPDADGGAIVTWTQGAAYPGNELHGSRVTPFGLIAPGWPPNGAFIAGVPSSEFMAIAAPVADQAGGFFQYIEHAPIFPFDEPRTSNLLHYDGIGQTAAGWPPEGLAPPGSMPNRGFGFTPDGGGGTYLSWRYQGAESRFLHVTSAGGPLAGWPAEGLNPCPDPILRCFASGMLADGEGGVWLALQRQPALPSDPYYLDLLRLDAGGGRHAGWTSAGVVLPFAYSSASYALHVSMAHGPGGACMLLYGAYADNGSEIPELHAARVEPGGELFTLGAWSAGQIPICTAPGTRIDPQLVDAPGGAVFAMWLDSRGGFDGKWTLYGMRIHPDGGTSVGVPPGALAARPLSVSPNPARGGAEVRFAMSERASAEVAVFDVAGRRVRTLASGDREAGEHTVPWDGRDAEGRMTRPGVYLVRARLGARFLETRLVRIE